VERRQQQRDEDRNNPDHHQQLNERKGVTPAYWTSHPAPRAGEPEDGTARRFGGEALPAVIESKGLENRGPHATPVGRHYVPNQRRNPVAQAAKLPRC
jgi:hypothetical protein